MAKLGGMCSALRAALLGADPAEGTFVLRRLKGCEAAFKVNAGGSLEFHRAVAIGDCGKFVSGLLRGAPVARVFARAEVRGDTSKLQKRVSEYFLEPRQFGGATAVRMEVDHIAPCSTVATMLALVAGHAHPDLPTHAEARTFLDVVMAYHNGPENACVVNAYYNKALSVIWARALGRDDRKPAAGVRIDEGDVEVMNYGAFSASVPIGKFAGTPNLIHNTLGYLAGGCRSFGAAMGASASACPTGSFLDNSYTLMAQMASVFADHLAFSG